MTRQRRHLIVKGRVHGVGFRWATCVEAEKLGVTGWVSNLPDGTVEVVAEGDDKAVEELVAWCQTGPGWAHVTGVEDKPEKPEGFDEFRIRY